MCIFTFVYENVYLIIDLVCLLFLITSFIHLILSERTPLPLHRRRISLNWRETQTLVLLNHYSTYKFGQRPKNFKPLNKIHFFLPRKVCMDEGMAPLIRHHRSCITYSVGIGHDFTFDFSMGELGCEVFAFDHDPYHALYQRNPFDRYVK